MKSLANSKKLKERILAKYNYDFFNSTKCVEKFGTHMGRRRTWKSHKWVFKRKGFLHYGTQKSLRYVWMERFSQCVHYNRQTYKLISFQRKTLVLRQEKRVFTRV